jgi:hypothetical protein
MIGSGGISDQKPARRARAHTYPSIDKTEARIERVRVRSILSAAGKSCSDPILVSRPRSAVKTARRPPALRTGCGEKGT